MGLDMSLTKKVYIGSEFEHNEISGMVDLKAHGKSIPIDIKKIRYVEEYAGYWRKANQIHAWFVRNVQDGHDDCKPYYVSKDQLKTLRALCVKVIETRDASMLPPQSGFFFGSTAIDEGYFDDLKETIKIIDALDLNSGEYYYQSSW